MVASLGINNNNAPQSSCFFSTSTSASSCEKEVEEDEEEGLEEGRVEVTVQRLDGVAWVDCGSSQKHKPHQLPLLTATVSFSGSSEDMQIGSSTVCGLTGQLLVESDPIRFDFNFYQSSSSNPASSSLSSSSSSVFPVDPLIPEDQAKHAVWLAAEWPEDAAAVTTTVTNTLPEHCNHSTVTASSSTLSSTTTTTTPIATLATTTTSVVVAPGQQQQPHVRMHFPGAEADPRLPKPCLVQSNRDSKIVKEEEEEENHHQVVVAAESAVCCHKKTNSDAGLETAGTCSTDFTSIMSNPSLLVAEGGGGGGGTTTPPLSPSLSLSSSQEQQFQNHCGSTTKISGMEELLSCSSSNHHHHHHQQQQHQQQIDNVNNAAAIEMARGESAFWSHSGHAMPEILELYIRLRCHDSSQNFQDTNLWEGVSFLVLFGQEDDKGSHIIDLPVRRPFLSVDPADSEDDLKVRPVGQDASSPDGPRLLLTSQARLRLKVTIIPDKKLRRNKRTASSGAGGGSSSSSSGPQHAQQSLMTTSIDAPSQESPVEVSLTRSTLEAKLKPLMDKIRENELLALQQWQAQKRAMDVHVPVPLNNNPNKDEKNATKKSYFYYPARGPHHYAMVQDGGCNNFSNHGDYCKLNDNVFSSMIWSWDRVVNLVTLPCGSCDGLFSSGAVDPGNDDGGILLQGGRGVHNNNSPLVIDVDAANFQDDSSTIATRESWGI